MHWGRKKHFTPSQDQTNKNYKKFNFCFLLDKISQEQNSSSLPFCENVRVDFNSSKEQSLIATDFFAPAMPCNSFLLSKKNES